MWETPGGGGYGDPNERLAELVEQDRRDGLVEDDTNVVALARGAEGNSPQ